MMNQWVYFAVAMVGVSWLLTAAVSRRRETLIDSLRQYVDRSIPDAVPDDPASADGRDGARDAESSDAPVTPDGASD